ncbi:hypothetical protein M5K25_015082 [Dendrobium thyrsiflorum]|uniref:Uncharacterized protein n=1 Tax=Dendrobium thyrsiflorum TaxID=117978 RepID=A0ABD0UWL6_DENTH
MIRHVGSGHHLPFYFAETSFPPSYFCLTVIFSASVSLNQEEMEDGVKMKSFRDEDMETRRIFLRSYPLRWDEEEEEEGGGEEEEEGESPQEQVVSSKKQRYFKFKSLMKRNAITVLHWGEGKLLLLKKMKNKVAFYLVACHPFGFKTSTKFITAA